MPTATAILETNPSRSDLSGSNLSQSILVIFPGALGDLICLIPTLRAIARRHPDSALELMARAELAAFARGRLGSLQGHSRSDSQGHSIDRREVAQLFAAGAGPIAAEARTFFGSYAHVYSFFAADNEDFRAALDAASGGHASYFPFRPPGDGHIAAAYLRQLDEQADMAMKTDSGEEIGGEGAAALDCSFELSREELNSARERLASLGLEVGKYVLVLPGSGSLAKNWPAENFAALAASLDPRIRSLVLLGPAEVELGTVFTNYWTNYWTSDEGACVAANGTADGADNRTDNPAAIGPRVIANLELAEVAALARLARCFVGNDSGVSHLAAAAGAPGLAIFGPTDPMRWRPLGRTTVIRREPLSTLTTQEVEAALLEIIAS